VSSAMGHRPTCRRALRRGLLSSRISPLRGECNSRIRYMFSGARVELLSVAVFSPPISEPISECCPDT
jgi:hypothetical protein